MAEMLSCLSSFNLVMMTWIFAFNMCGETMTHHLESKLVYNFIIPCDYWDNHVLCHLTDVSMCLQFRARSRDDLSSTSILFSLFDDGPFGLLLQIQHSSNGLLWIRHSEGTSLIFDEGNPLNESSWHHLCFVMSSNDVSNLFTLVMNGKNNTLILPARKEKAIEINEKPEEHMQRRKVEIAFGGDKLLFENSTAPSLFDCIRGVAFSVHGIINVSYDVTVTDGSNDICHGQCHTNQPCLATQEQCSNIHAINASDVARCKCLSKEKSGKSCDVFQSTDFSESLGWVILLISSPIVLLVISLAIYCLVASKKLRQSKEEEKEKGQQRSSRVELDQCQSKRNTISSQLPSSLSCSIDLEWDPQAETRINSPDLEWDHDAHNPDISDYSNTEYREFDPITWDGECYALNAKSSTDT